MLSPLQLQLPLHLLYIPHHPRIRTRQHLDLLSLLPLPLPRYLICSPVHQPLRHLPPGLPPHLPLRLLEPNIKLLLQPLHLRIELKYRLELAFSELPIQCLHLQRYPVFAGGPLPLGTGCRDRFEGPG